MYPECATKIERILFMGGAVSVGNATAVAEFNIRHDPEATHIALRVIGDAGAVCALVAHYLTNIAPSSTGPTRCR